MTTDFDDSENFSSAPYPLPPYTVAVQRFPWVKGPNRETEIVAVKRIDGRWDVLDGEVGWFKTDEEMYEQWPEVEIIGMGIWPE